MKKIKKKTVKRIEKKKKITKNIRMIDDSLNKFI